MVRLIVSVVIGLLCAFALVFAGEFVFHALSVGERPAGNGPALAAYVAGQPLGALLSVVAGWTVAVLAGAAVATRIGQRGTTPGTVTGVFLLATLFNFFLVTHPVWMVIASAVAILAGGWLGTRPGMIRTTAAR